MDVLEAIHRRRSVRDFLNQPVPDDVIRQIIEAGTWAPSSGNMQAWEFVIAKSDAARRRVVDTTDAGTTSRGGVHTQEWIMTAPVIIVVCYDVKRMTARYGLKGRQLMTLLDCMGAAENMLLAATGLGVASCCVIGFTPQRLKETLPIPKEITPLLLIPMGYTAVAPLPPHRLAVDDVVRAIL